MKNTLKFIFRKFVKQRVNTVINLVGLSLGFIFAILAFLYAQIELSYDNQYSNTDDVYQLACNNNRNAKMHYGQPSIFFEAILKQIPEIQDGIRVKWQKENLLVAGKRFKEDDFIYSEPFFFDFFGWPLVKGNPKEVLKAPLSVTISEGKAALLFGDEDPVGKVINLGNEFDFTITGVFKDLPDQSHLKTNFVASLSSYNYMDPNYFKWWGWHDAGVYFRINSIAQVKDVEVKIAEVWNKESTDKPCTGKHIKASLKPFNKVHYTIGEVVGGVSPRDYVVGFGIIALLIFIISCFNFINLSLAVLTKTYPEKGLKKMLGADIKFYLHEIFTELFIYLIFSLCISFVVLRGSLAFVNNFLQKELSVNLLTNFSLDLFILSIVVLILSVCGLVPISQVLKINPMACLKGNNFSVFTGNTTKKNQVLVRNLLVTTQFSIGIFLIITTITVNQQLKLIREHDAGFDKEQTFYVWNFEGDQGQRYENFAHLLREMPAVRAVSSGSNVPLDGIYNWGGPKVLDESESSMQGCGFISVNDNYFNLIGARFVLGRDFLQGNIDKDKIIITKSLAKALNLTNPIGKKLGDLWDDKPREIIGVVDDIEYNTIHNERLPVVFFNKREGSLLPYSIILVKLQASEIGKAMAKINQAWDDVSPDFPFEYTFLDQKFNDNYLQETKIGQFINIMAFVAMFLCAMGLFAMTLANINSRVKEVGIRKVNGARIREVIYMLNKNFMVWIGIAFVIITPVAYYALNKWLEIFVLKTALSWWIFALSGFVTLVIVLITVSWQSWRAATRNPVETLRYE